MRFGKSAVRMGQLSTILIIFLAAVLWPLFSGYAEEAREAIGKVVALRGKVTAIDLQGASRSLSIKSPLYLNDTVDTGKRGRLQILFKDNTILSLGAGSKVKITAYGWDESKEKAEMTTEIKEGLFRVMGGLIAKEAPAKFKTKTPLATIGIRGSMYAGSLLSGELSVVFEGGRGIELTNEAGRVAITSPGFGTRITGSSTPIPPASRFSSESMQHLRLTVTDGPATRGAARPSATQPLPVTFPPGELSVSPPPAGSKGRDGESAAPEPEGGQEPQEEPARELTEAAKGQPDQAAALLTEAVGSGDLPLEKALEAILAGMQNTDRAHFDALIQTAIDLGLTSRGAQDIADHIKASGGGCP